MKTTIDKIKVPFNGTQVTAYKLTVASEICIDIDTAWEKVKTSALLEFVTKGKVIFKPTGGQFPEIWKQGSTITTKMLLYGFICLFFVYHDLH